jgi:hypothetical protein
MCTAFVTSAARLHRVALGSLRLVALCSRRWLAAPSPSHCSHLPDLFTHSLWPCSRVQRSHRRLGRAPAFDVHCNCDSALSGHPQHFSSRPVLYATCCSIASPPIYHQRLLLLAGASAPVAPDVSSFYALLLLSTVLAHRYPAGSAADRLLSTTLPTMLDSLIARRSRVHLCPPPCLITLSRHCHSLLLLTWSFTGFYPIRPTHCRVASSFTLFVCCC